MTQGVEDNVKSNIRNDDEVLRAVYGYRYAANQNDFHQTNVNAIRDNIEALKKNLEIATNDLYESIENRRQARADLQKAIDASTFDGE